MQNQTIYLKDEDGNLVEYKLVPTGEKFNTDLPVEAPTVETRTPRADHNVKVAFVVGHYEAAQGAHSRFLGVTEWDLWNGFVDSHLFGMGDKFLHSNNSSYSQRQAETAERTKDYDLVFELHFNAGSAAAHGVEALVFHGNDLMKKVAAYYSSEMNASMGYNIRRGDGVIEADSSDNGFGFLQKTKNDAILLEPFFGSNEADCHRFDKDKYAEVIRKTIAKYAELKG